VKVKRCFGASISPPSSGLKNAKQETISALLYASWWFHAWLTLQCSRWRQHVLPRH
jgi:hypothetical protein